MRMTAILTGHNKTTIKITATAANNKAKQKAAIIMRRLTIITTPITNKEGEIVHQTQQPIKLNNQSFK